MRFTPLLYILFLSACATDSVIEEITKEFVIPEDIQTVVDAAKRAENDGDFSAAKEAYQAALDKDSEDLSARWGMASLYLRQGRVDEAGNLYMDITREPFCLSESKVIVEKVVTAQDVDEGEEPTEFMLLEQRRYCSLAWNGLGVIADIQGHFVMAEEAYKEALSLNSHESSVYNNYGYSLMMSHRYNEAESMLIKGYALAPESERIRTNLALSKAWLGKYQDALETYSYTLKDPEAYNDIGYIALLRNDYEMAIELFEKAIIMSPVFYKKAAQNLDRAQRLEEASKRNQAVSG